MIKVNIKAKVKEIRFKGENSCVFVVEEDKKELVCTITKRNIELADLVKEGQEVTIDGNITAYRRVRADREFIENVLYVNELKEV
jgi:exonuclease VII large subunit